jgi:hypothetical protein
MRRVVQRMVVAAATIGAVVLPVVPNTFEDAAAAGSVRAAVSLTAPTSGKYSTTVALSGTAWRYGTTTKLANATVWLQRSVHGKNTWSNLTSTRTSSTGTFSFPVVQRSAYDYRAYYGGSPMYTSALSGVVYPAVLQNLILNHLNDVNWTLGTLEASVHIAPVPPSGTQIWLQRYDAAAKVWRNYISGRSTGSQTLVIRGNVSGSVGTYRVYAPLRYPYGAGYTNAVSHSHVKWRGAFARTTPAGGSANWHFTVLPEDTARRTAVAIADKGGNVWADLNTSGCTRLTSTLENHADGVVRVAFTGTPATVDIPRATNGSTPTVRSLAATFSAISTIRAQVTDVGSTLGPAVQLNVSLLCAN